MSESPFINSGTKLTKTMQVKMNSNTYAKMKTLIAESQMKHAAFMPIFMETVVNKEYDKFIERQF